MDTVGMEWKIHFFREEGDKWMDDGSRWTVEKKKKKKKAKKKKIERGWLTRINAGAWRDAVSVFCPFRGGRALS